MTNEELVSIIQTGENVKEPLLMLYNQNKGLLWKLCRKYSRDQEMEDLIQQAYIGLHRAAYEYREGEGASFVTYAYPVIKRELERYIATCGRLIQISERERYLYYQYRKIEEYFMQIFNREPSEAESARFLQVPVKTVRQMKERLHQAAIASLDLPLGEDTEDTLADLIADKAHNTEGDYIDALISEESGKALHEEIARLEPQQRAVIRFSMDGLTTAQAGEAMGITREQARTLEGKAFRALRCSRKVLQAGRNLDIVCW